MYALTGCGPVKMRALPGDERAEMGVPPGGGSGRLELGALQRSSGGRRECTPWLKASADGSASPGRRL